MKSFTIEVTQTVRVRIDEKKLSPLMDQFNRTITDFGYDGDAVELHAKHIAQLAARGVVDFGPRDFVEGYGNVDEAGISVLIENDTYCDVVGA